MQFLTSAQFGGGGVNCPLTWPSRVPGRYRLISVFAYCRDFQRYVIDVSHRLNTHTPFFDINITGRPTIAALRYAGSQYESRLSAVWRVVNIYLRPKRRKLCNMCQTPYKRTETIDCPFVRMSLSLCPLCMWVDDTRCFIEM